MRAANPVAARRLPRWTPLVLLPALAVALFPALQDVLVYERRAILDGQLWRLVTGQWVHLSASHLGLNAAGLAAAGWVAERRSEPGFGALCLAAPVAIGVALLALEPDLVRFGGLSGLATAAASYVALRGLHGSGARRLACALVLVGLAVKLGLETWTGQALFARGDGALRVVPLCHAVGAGSALAVWAATRMRRGRAWRLAPALVCAALLGVACAPPAAHRATSLVDYLYPGEIGRVEVPRLPVLRLPLRAGVAFVPGHPGDAPAVSEKRQLDLARQLAAEFERLEFVESIAVVPTTELGRRAGFANLDRLRTRLGLDVIALLSYDQSQFTGDTSASISYWTLVGAYVVKGQRNDTHTLIDAAVYDIATRQLLLRAAGASQIASRATPVGVVDQLRLDRERGFEAAVADLVPRLRAEVRAFADRIAAERRPPAPPQPSGP